MSEPVNESVVPINTIKWILIVASVCLGAYFLLPILAKMALDFVTFVLLGIGGIGLVILLPAICEAFATLSYKLTESIWMADPMTRLKRDYAANARDLDTLEYKISEANAAIISLERMVIEQKALLSDASLKDKQAQLTQLRGMGNQLVRLRDTELQRHEEYGREIKQAEAELKIGNAFGQALKAFKFAKGMGPRSQGSQVALATIRDKVAASQSRLALVLSRPLGQLPQGGGEGHDQLTR